jgi:hypothetical protein
MTDAVRLMLQATCSLCTHRPRRDHHLLIASGSANPPESTSARRTGLPAARVAYRPVPASAAELVAKIPGHALVLNPTEPRSTDCAARVRAGPPPPGLGDPAMPCSAR